MEVLAKRLKWLREKERYAQKDIAKKIGMTASGYQKIEYGERDPKLDVLVSLSDIFKVSTDFLLGRNNDTGILKEYTYKIHVYKTLYNQLQSELSHILMKQIEIQDQIKHYQEIKEENHKQDLPFRDSNIRDTLKIREQVLSELLIRKKEVQDKLHEAHKNHCVFLYEYIIELLDLPESKPYEDTVLKGYLPFNIEIQPDIFGNFSLHLSGENIGFIGHYGNYETIEEIQIEKEKLLKILNGNQN